ncbi:Threonine/homoserine efflux transporter RhtA [Nannocystis exedens]|uniref:Threonine/homoserine efflux transporter RhtA n=1 Tax=Nannocystis exedens TaxID=54 RepID=A0A1I2AYJ7_9BACT|nr:DMT family transporter [Nannocystis exedens]PCC74353.1 EamA-like transporter family protein [Nannocystis exedens]SFE48896.1 Threonine/homoserine efflux transporter RhtA [Nannocystis exedens]
MTADFSPPRAPLLLVALGAAVISVTALFVKWIALGPAAIGAYRCGLGAAALLPIAGLALWTGPNRQVKRRGSAVAWAALAGACFAGDLFVWHKSILYSGTGLATLLANTQVFWVALFSALLLGERLTRRLGVCALLALVGTVMLALPGIERSPVHLQGVLLGLLTGVFYAGYYLSLRTAQRGERPLGVAAALLVSSATAAALLVLAALATGESLAVASAGDFGLLLLLGIGAHVGGWALISRGMPHVPAASGSLLLLLQPVLATLWGVLVFAEPFGAVEAAGTALSLAAIYAASVSRSPPR